MQLKIAAAKLVICFVTESALVKNQGFLCFTAAELHAVSLMSSHDFSVKVYCSSYGLLMGCSCGAEIIRS